MFSVWLVASGIGFCVALVALLWGAIDNAQRLDRLERALGLDKRSARKDSDEGDNG